MLKSVTEDKNTMRKKYAWEHLREVWYLPCFGFFLLLSFSVRTKATAGEFTETLNDVIEPALNIVCKWTKGKSLGAKSELVLLTIKNNTYLVVIFDEKLDFKNFIEDVKHVKNEWEELGTLSPESRNGSTRQSSDLLSHTVVWCAEKVH